MGSTVIVVLAAVLLVSVLFFEKKGRTKGVLLSKAPLSLLFILTALLQTYPLLGYYCLMLLGFLFCLGGDVFLALPQRRMFLFGLVSFLLGHVFYTIGFFMLASVNSATWIGGLLGVILGGWVFHWLKPHLGKMTIPVSVYILVITAMVVGAWSVVGDSGLAAEGRVGVFVGAILFYVSDIFVARNRFIKTEMKNRYIGLPMYYAGQFTLAFSIGLF